MASVTFTLRSAILASLLSSAHASLTHRYTFEDGTAKDTIGELHGKLVGCGATVAQGKLLLNTDPCAGPEMESFLEFPGSPLPTKGSVSVLVWFTAKEGEPYTRVFDFGAKEGGEGRQFFYFSPRTADGTARVAITATDKYAKTNVDFRVMDNGTPHMIAVVINGDSKTLLVYVDGKAVAKPEYLGRNSLEKVDPRCCWLGKSLFSDNPLLNGSIDEFRVYDHPLTSAEIEGDYLAGPNTLSPQAISKPE